MAIATRGSGNDLGPFSKADINHGRPGEIEAVNPVAQRALTQNETNFLQNILKKGAVPVLRLLGAITGLGAIMLVILAATGQPVNSATYSPEVVITGILGMVFGGASQSLRYPVRAALARGTALEVYGVPEIGTGNGRSVPVKLAGLSFHLRPSQVARLRPGRMNKMSYAEAGPAGRKALKTGLSTALVLEWNGIAVTRRETIRLLDTGRVTGARK